jgi:hypothetical protein
MALTRLVLTARRRVEFDDNDPNSPQGWFMELMDEVERDDGIIRLRSPQGSPAAGADTAVPGALVAMVEQPDELGGLRSNKPGAMDAEQQHRPADPGLTDIWTMT